MSDLSVGNHADVVLNAGDVLRVSTGGVATVVPSYGAPAGTTTITANTQDFGPYSVPAKLAVNAVSGTASYSNVAAYPVVRNPDGKLYAGGTLVDGGGLSDAYEARRDGVVANGADQSAAFAAALANAIAGGYAQFVLPKGDIVLSGAALDFTEAAAFNLPNRTSRPTNQAPYTACRGLEVIGHGNGMTRLRLAADGTAMRFYGKITNGLSYIGVRDLQIEGPWSKPVTRQGTLTTGSSVITGLSSVAGLAVGMWVEDLQNDWIANTKGFPPNCRIVSIDSGSQITVSQNWTGSAGAWLLFTADSCGLQFGGVTANRSDVIGAVNVKNVMIGGFFTGVRLDDVTGFHISDSALDGNIIGLESAYNCDQIVIGSNTFIQGRSHVQSSSIAVTSGSAVTTINSLANGENGDFLTPGAYIADLTSFNAGTLTRVAAASGTSMTLSANYPAATGDKNFRLLSGIGMAIGMTGPWRPAFNTSSAGANGWVVRNALFNQLAFVALVPDSTRTWSMEDCYFEGVYGLVRASKKTDAGTLSIAVERNHFSQPASFQGYGVVELAANNGGSPNPKVRFIGNTSDTPAGALTGFCTPIIYAPTFNAVGGCRLWWEQNGDLGMQTTLAADQVRMGSSGWNPGDQQMAFGYGVGATAYDRNIGAALTGNTSVSPGGHRTIRGTLSGSVAFTNATNSAVPQGQDICYQLTSNASGQTVGFGTNWVDAAGGALTTSAASTSSAQIIQFNFRFNGSKFVLQNSPAWIA